ncbi:beta-carotene 15,15' [Octopus vulgaris]|nr:beta-carotene 15,15' [Octopus vulgaris]
MCVSATLFAPLLLSACVLSVSSLATDSPELTDTFGSLYTTNLKEFNDFPIYFDRKIPEWLKGNLIRNGFGQFENGKRHFLHMFDSFAKLSSWKITGNNTALFSTKFVKSSTYNQSMATDDIAPYLTFIGVEPPFSRWKQFKSIINGLDNMNVNVYSYHKTAKANGQDGKGCFALTDYWKMYEFNCTTLQTISAFEAPVPQKSSLGFLNLISTAHPLPEFGTNNSLLFLSTLSLVPWVKSSVKFIRIHTAEKREVIASVPVDQIPYMHSFSTTEHYGILFCHPMYLNIPKFLKEMHPFDGMDWYGDRPIDVNIINLKTGEIIKMKTENSFVMHHANAYEDEDGNIIVDAVGYDDPLFVKSMLVENMVNPAKRKNIPFSAQIRRYIFNVQNKTSKVHTFSRPSNETFLTRFDFPTINENYRSKPYCFLYGVALRAIDNNLTSIALIKKDVCEKGRDKYYYKTGVYVSEAIFVPTPNAEEEDDGVLLLPAADASTNKHYLYVIDAKTMTLISQAELPTTVPYTLHGHFIPEKL